MTFLYIVYSVNMIIMFHNLVFFVFIGEKKNDRRENGETGNARKENGGIGKDGKGNAKKKPLGMSSAQKKLTVLISTIHE